MSDRGRRRCAVVAFSALGLGLAGCGEAGQSLGESPTGGSAGGTAGATTGSSAAGAESGGPLSLGAPTGAEQESTPVSPSGAPPRSIAVSRVARLSHRQWENTVRDLLLLDTASELSSRFPVQSLGGGYLFDNRVEALSVDQALSGAYAAAAAELARLATSDNARLARLLPAASADDEARARAFVERFGRRAFRRPLTPEEMDAYFLQWERGQSLYEEMAGFEAGIRLVIETLLQSPHFLYRIETGEASSGGVEALSDWEVAQRLSYFLVNTMPDEALFEAAVAGSLGHRAGVRLQAERLLRKPAASRAVGHFHEQLFELESYLGIAPGAQQFPEAPVGLGKLAHDSALAFVDEVVFGRREAFRDLMTSTRAFANRELADLYGVSGSVGAELEPVELPRDQRSGLLTQVGFLAANATGSNPDPIHRGVFVAKRLLCRNITAPPDDVVPPPPTGEGTNRQIVEVHTETLAGCRSCHSSLINPYGFVFENYDALGAYRTLDSGLPVDASVSVFLDGIQRDVTGGVEFTQALANSREAHACFVGHLLEYALGRVLVEEDQSLVDSLTEASLADEPIADLLVQVAESPAFIGNDGELLP